MKANAVSIRRCGELLSITIRKAVSPEVLTAALTSSFGYLVSSEGGAE